MPVVKSTSGGRKRLQRRRDRFRARFAMARRLRIIDLWWMIARLRVSYRQAFYIERWLTQKERDIRRATLDAVEERVRAQLIRG